MRPNGHRLGEKPATAASRAAALTTHRRFVLSFILAAGFVVRLARANANSYWVDELISVKRYVLDFGSPGDMVRALAEESIHPPLYQLMLYGWVQLFGDAEVATRTLSNVLVTAAAGFTYLMVRRMQPTWVALGAAAFVNLGHYAMWYGLEARSYSVTLALAAVSCWTLIGVLQEVRSGPGAWRGRPLLAMAVAWSVSVAGLLFTHYYNAFFVASQMLLLAVYGVHGLATRRIQPSGFVVIVIAVAAPMVGFVGAWLPVILAAFERNAGRFARGDGYFPPRNPEQMLTGFSEKTLVVGTWATLTLLVFAVALVAYAAWRHRRDAGVPAPAWTLLTPVVLLVGPVTIAYITFVSTSFERWSSRYYIYLLPPLAALIGTAARTAAQSLARGPFVPPAVRQHVRHHAVAYVLATVMVLVFVPGLNAATAAKTDHRGIAQQVIHLVESTPERSFVIYSTEARARHQFLEYYLARFSDDVTVAGQISRYDEEWAGVPFAFEAEEDFIREHDYLVVVFAWEQTITFPRAIDILTSTYDLVVTQLNSDHREGFLLFAAN